MGNTAPPGACPLPQGEVKPLNMSGLPTFFSHRKVPLCPRHILCPLLFTKDHNSSNSRVGRLRRGVTVRAMGTLIFFLNLGYGHATLREELFLSGGAAQAQFRTGWRNGQEKGPALQPSGFTGVAWTVTRGQEESRRGAGRIASVCRGRHHEDCLSVRYPSPTRSAERPRRRRVNPCWRLLTSKYGKRKRRIPLSGSGERGMRLRLLPHPRRCSRSSDTWGKGSPCISRLHKCRLGGPSSSESTEYHDGLQHPPAGDLFAARCCGQLALNVTRVEPSRRSLQSSCCASRVIWVLVHSRPAGSSGTPVAAHSVITR